MGTKSDVIVMDQNDLEHLGKKQINYWWEVIMSQFTKITFKTWENGEGIGL